MLNLNYWLLFWGILSWLEGIICVILFVIHVKRSCKKKRITHATPKCGTFLKIINNAIFMVYIMYLIISGIHRMTIIGILNINRKVSCFILQPLLFVLFNISRKIILLIFLTRIKTAFDGSMYQYNNKCINSLYISIFLVAIGSGIAHKFAGSYELNDDNMCILRIPLWASLTQFTIDAIYSPVLLYMFIRPMKMLEKNRSDHNKQNTHNLFRDLIVKYYLLSFISIVSTLLLYGLSIFNNAFIFAILDSFINYICIYLLIGHNKNMYYWLCNRCHIWCIKYYGFHIKRKSASNDGKTTKSIENLKKYLEITGESPKSTQATQTTTNNTEIVKM